MFDAAYGTPEGRDWQRWTYDFKLPYAKTLQSGKYGVVVLFYTTSLSTPSLSGNMVFSAPNAHIGGQLLNLVSENSRNPNLANFTVALEQNKSYELVAFGPYDNDTASGVYAIWKRIATHSTATHQTQKKVVKR
jgi:hypothetical protein